MAKPSLVVYLCNHGPMGTTTTVVYGGYAVCLQWADVGRVVIELFQMMGSQVPPELLRASTDMLAAAAEAQDVGESLIEQAGGALIIWDEDQRGQLQAYIDKELAQPNRWGICIEQRPGDEGQLERRIFLNELLAALSGGETIYFNQQQITSWMPDHRLNTLVFPELKHEWADGEHVTPAVTMLWCPGMGGGGCHCR